MELEYLVSGSNLFGQWFAKEPIIEIFKNITKSCDCDSSTDFNVKYAKLVCMCWSYNIFKWKDDFFVTGAWAGEENVKTKIDIIREYDLSTSELTIVGNDYNLVLLDIKKLKIWILCLKERLQVTSLDLKCECPITLQITQQSDIKIVKAVATNTSFLYLTNMGSVLFGMKPSYLDTSHCVGKVCDIACGYNHYMLLTDAGYLYSWGCGQRLQLGHGDIEYLETPKEVHALAGLKIIKIAAGGFHCLALSEYGDLYAWGWNDMGQLGITTKDEAVQNCNNPISCSLPKLLDIYDENGILVEFNVVDIAAGSRHSVIMLEDTSVWASEYNKYGQLGLSPEKYPTVKCFKKILNCDLHFKLMCGTWSTVLIRNSFSSDT
ncbi:unnamed protein product [Parnassius apollo]|uniref:(apollo) hypothetical protein n=1 Tax=Parnassius apollo TaxID=110799 RepID=A0A8S3XSH8_PARAO|nr:unnamed protein product [Parnassius apollo]